MLVNSSCTAIRNYSRGLRYSLVVSTHRLQAGGKLVNTVHVAGAMLTGVLLKDLQKTFAKQLFAIPKPSSNRSLQAMRQVIELFDYVDDLAAPWLLSTDN